MARWLRNIWVYCCKDITRLAGDPIVAEQFCALRLSAQTGSRAFGASKMVDASVVEHVGRVKG